MFICLLEALYFYFCDSKFIKGMALLKNIESLKVSVIMPTHNRVDLLQRAISSVLSQTYANIELIVVDDASTDSTPALLQQYAGEIKSFKNAQASGACEARNKGVEMATGDLLLFLDDDDEYKENAVESLVRAYDSSWAFITGGIDYIKTTGKVEQMIPKKILDYSFAATRASIGVFLLVKRERMLSVGAFDAELTSSQDRDLWLRLIKKYGNALGLQKTLYIMHTEHEKGRISTSPKKYLGHYMFYKKHRNDFGVAERKYNLFLLKKYANKRLSLKNICLLMTSANWDLVLKYWLKRNVLV